MQFGNHILIVDDVSDNIQVAMNILREQNYDFSFALNGEDAIKLATENSPDLILLDIMMPGIDGFEVCSKLKAKPATADIPIIFLTAKVDVDSISKGFELGAVDYIAKPFQGEELIARVKNHLDLSNAKKVLSYNNLSLEIKLARKELRLAEEIRQYQKEMVNVLTGLMEVTSDETAQHVRRVARLARFLALQDDRLTDEDAEVIFYASPLHDIGKIALPHGLLEKPGKLTAEEFSMMQTHTLKAHQFLQHSHRLIMESADIIALQHHENWDGTGYPNNLSGEDIHLYGRVVALVDVFDALISERCYKKAWPLDEALEYIKSRKGSQFDPHLVDLFVEHFDQITTLVSE